MIVTCMYVCMHACMRCSLLSTQAQQPGKACIRIYAHVHACIMAGKKGKEEDKEEEEGKEEDAEEKTAAAAAENEKDDMPKDAPAKKGRGAAKAKPPAKKEVSYHVHGSSTCNTCTCCSVDTTPASWHFLHMLLLHVSRVLEACSCLCACMLDMVCMYVYICMHGCMYVR
jgi:hypothetical protein